MSTSKAPVPPKKRVHFTEPPPSIDKTSDDSATETDEMPTLASPSPATTPNISGAADTQNSQPVKLPATYQGTRIRKVAVREGNIRGLYASTDELYDELGRQDERIIALQNEVKGLTKDCAAHKGQEHKIAFLETTVVRLESAIKKLAAAPSPAATSSPKPTNPVTPNKRPRSDASSLPPASITTPKRQRPDVSYPSPATMPTSPFSTGRYHRASAPSPPPAATNDDGWNLFLVSGSWA